MTTLWELSAFIALRKRVVRRSLGGGLLCAVCEGESEVAQACPALCDPVDCRPPGSSVHGLLQAGVLECVPFPSPGCICAPPKEQRRRCRHGRREYSEFASPGGTRVSAVPRRLELSCSLPARALPTMGLANSARSEIRCDHRKGRDATHKASLSSSLPSLDSNASGASCLSNIQVLVAKEAEDTTALLLLPANSISRD